MTPVKLAVAIVGGGLAGNLLARQLRRAAPDLQIGLFEKSTEPSFKVGESLVEVASNYLLRRLGLSSYLYDRHYPKNGLRFFFDGPARDFELHEMSEIGSDGLPFLPAFQIDRARCEGDLLAMNAEDEVLVRTGVEVRDLELGRDGALHRFSTSDGRNRSEYEARWVVDASGRSRMIARGSGCLNTFGVPSGTTHSGLS